MFGITLMWRIIVHINLASLMFMSPKIISEDISCWLLIFIIMYTYRMNVSIHLRTSFPRITESFELMNCRNVIL